MFKYGSFLLVLGVLASWLLPGTMDIGLVPIFAGAAMMLVDDN